MTWDIRSIDPSEAGLIVPLLGQVQSLHAAARPDIFRAGATPDDLRRVLHGLLARDGLTALATLTPDRQAMGYVIYGIETVGGSTLRQAETFAVLHHVCVDGAWRRRGIGSALIEEMRLRLRMLKVARLCTTCRAFNEASAALMRKAGLSPFQIRAEGPV